MVSFLRWDSGCFSTFIFYTLYSLLLALFTDNSFSIYHTGSSCCKHRHMITVLLSQVFTCSLPSFYLFYLEHSSSPLGANVILCMKFPWSISLFIIQLVLPNYGFHIHGVKIFGKKLCPNKTCTDLFSCYFPPEQHSMTSIYIVLGII